MKQFICVFTFAVIISACEKTSSSKGLDTITPIAIGADPSFLPMHIGNYWRIGTNSTIDITDTTRIAGNLYYKFTSITGGDVYGVRYLRIDANNQLLEGYPTQPGIEYLHARFNDNPGDTFYTLNDKTWNDWKVIMKEKTNDKRVFDWEMVYHPNMKGQLVKHSFGRGIGWCDDNWDSVRINSVVYRR